MRTVTDEQLKDATRRLVEALQPLQIYLFGSQARGTADPDSDVDFYVVVEDACQQDLRHLGQAAHRAMRRYPHPKDVLVRSQEVFERRKQLRSSVEADVAGEGVLLYDARHAEQAAG